MDPDAALIREIAGGAPEALSRLYDRHAGKVYGLARRILFRAEDAEEVVQDVFAQVWRDAGRYRSERASIAGWIVMLTRTRAIDRLRARRARPDLERGFEPPDGLVVPAGEPDPEQVSISLQEGGLVRTALAGLPEQQRSLLELAYFDGLSHTEIAARTQVPLGTVKTRIRSAMQALREVLSS